MVLRFPRGACGRLVLQERIWILPYINMNPTQYCEAIILQLKIKKKEKKKRKDLENCAFNKHPEIFQAQWWLGKTGIRWVAADKETFLSLAKPSSGCIQPCLSLCNPMDCSPPGSSVCGILWARALRWVSMPFSRGPPDPETEPTAPELSRGSLPLVPPGKEVQTIIR